MSHPDTSGRQIIEMTRAVKRYGPILALNDMTLSFGPGITGLVGPNGAGKSTIIGLVTGLMPPSSGRIRVLGDDPWSDTPLRGRIGYCPDGDHVWPGMTGREFVTRLGIYAGLEPAEAARRTEDALSRVGLAPAMDKPVSQYSKGMRQKAKLCQAILHRPELLVLDEPLNGVDPVSRVEILKALKDMAAQGMAILVSSHVLHELETAIDRVVLIHRGRLLAEGTVEEIRDLLDEHPHTVRLESPEPRKLASALLVLDGVVGVQLVDGRTVDVATRDPAQFYAHLPDVVTGSGLGVEALWSPDSNLEAVFRYLVKGGGG
ncbi:MAG: ABC transporter ATP-binding protein [Deltaproteobacteria bacterium]|nr:ABC transporter ATP-binding protein [Deltaproteobacteria bacterium]